MHLPRIRREVFIFRLSFSLSPSLWVLVYLSEPARSHIDNLKADKENLFYLSQNMHKLFTFKNNHFVQRKNFLIFICTNPSILFKFHHTSGQTISQHTSYFPSPHPLPFEFRSTAGQQNLVLNSTATRQLEVECQVLYECRKWGNQHTHMRHPGSTGRTVQYQYTNMEDNRQLHHRRRERFCSELTH